MSHTIIKTLEAKGIKIPEHHVPLLLMQWEYYQQLKAHPMFAELGEEDIGLRNIPEGGEKE